MEKNTADSILELLITKTVIINYILDPLKGVFFSMMYLQIPSLLAIYFTNHL